MSPPAVQNWIYVTGMIRSGTTFLATVLSHPLNVDYIHEPFNGGYVLPERIALLPRYVRPNDQSESARRYREHVSRLFEYRIGMRSARYDEDPMFRRWIKSIVGSRGPFYLRFAKLNPWHEHALIKDPMAGLTTGFLHQEFGVKPVIIVRHPVSLAASLKRLGWFPQVYDFALQPDVIRDYLSDDVHLIERSWDNRLLESMAHWRLLYKVLLDQADARGDWVVVTHEELSARPVEVFSRIYQDCGLPWSEGVRSKILSLTKNDGKTQAADGRVQDFVRDSASIFEARRDAVDPELRRQIYEITADVALRLYDRESFGLSVSVGA